MASGTPRPAHPLGEDRLSGPQVALQGHHVSRPQTAPSRAPSRRVSWGEAADSLKGPVREADLARALPDHAPCAPSERSTDQGYYPALACGMGYDVLAIAPTSFFADYGCPYGSWRKQGPGAPGAPGDRLHLPQRARPAGVQVRRIPRVPWHAEVRVGSYHKLYFDALLAGAQPAGLSGAGGRGARPPARQGLDRLLRQPPRRVPLVFDYQGHGPEMVDHQFLRRESPLYRPVAWLERTIDGLADVILTSSTNAAEAIPPGGAAAGGWPQAPEGRRGGGGPWWRPSWTGWTYTPSTGPTRKRWPPRARYGIRRSAWWWATWGCWPSTGVAT